MKKVFFFEKKNQKTFVPRRTPPARRVPTDKSFLLLFFKKEGLSAFLTFCTLITPCARAAGVFACSVGKKAVSVTQDGGRFTYTFGAPGRADISIVGSAAQKNVFYREDRYAGMEHQLRFSNGEYSYIVYNMEGNDRTGAAASSGLVVMKGTKTIADLPCARYTEFGVGFDYNTLPADTEAYSAM
jgi:hypothetical protein